MIADSSHEQMASQEELDHAVLRALCEVLEAGDTEYQIEVASVEVTLEKAYARSDTWVVLPHFEEKLQHATGPNITLNALEHSVWMLIKKLLGDTPADQYEGEDDHDRAFEANDRPVVQFPENAVAFTHDGLPEGDRYHIQLYEDFVKMYGDALSFEEWLSPRTQI